MDTPRKQRRLEVLARHADRLARHMGRLERLDQRFFWLRLIALLAGLPAVYLAFSVGSAATGWLTTLAAVGLFTLIVAQHRRLDRARLRLRLRREFTLTQIARAQLDWAKLPQPLSQAVTSEHPFAADLNLVGDRSLHQLLDTAASTGGSQRLLGWLLDNQPDPENITSRQALLIEMLPLTSLRHQLALRSMLVAGSGSERWNGEQLVDWLQKHVTTPSSGLFLGLLSLLAAANLALFGLNLATGLPAYWVVTLALYGWLYVYRQREISEVFDQAYHLQTTLEQFRTVLAYLERYPFPASTHLIRLAEPFWQPERRPSKQLRTLTIILSAASLRHNPFLWVVINAILPWDFYFAFRLGRHKQALLAILPAWLEAWYELEALNSIANFSYLNPEATFPEIGALRAAGSAAVFTTQALGHPLIPDADRVCNDFHLAHLGEIALITGSNMSGKSTFLRTIGINLRLAYAGGPVIAAHLQAIPFRLFTSLNIRDSLSDGISFFYAEVKRLKALLSALQAGDQPPLFFLIDEIFRGTNNMEREIGSRAYLRALAQPHGVGCIATHDLALVHLADEVPSLQNYHFREEIHAGRMHFDYTIRPGPCPTTNALEIMRLEGLPVPTEPVERAS